jgi:suppressor of G2 allele of SKP1
MKGPVNWEKIEKEAIKEEEDTKLEGDAAVNQMFSKIYADASDDMKKAMIKSYQESAGTCLSTNWSEVKQKKVEITPPDSMEYKRYDD